MKKHLILIAAMMMSTIIYAQHGHDHDKKRLDVSEKMKKELSLNDAQVQAIKSIETKYNDKQVALRKDSSKSRDLKMDVMKSMRLEKSKEVNAVLTADQSAKWESSKKAEGEKGKARMVEASQKFEQKVKTDLALTNDQFAKFQAENTRFKQKLSDLRKDKQVNHKEVFDKLKADHDANLKSILSADQFQKWAKMKEDMKKQGNHNHKHRG
ncbi:MAG: hypothetical protein ABJA70_23010 [Chryseolinea sp.]